MNSAPSLNQREPRNLMPVIVGVSMALLFLTRFRIADPTGMGPGFGVSASAAGALYTCVVLLSLHSSRTAHTYFTACLGTLLVCIQIYWAPAPGGAPLLGLLLNVGLVLLSIWGTALLGISTVHRARKESAQLAEAQVIQEQALAQQYILEKLGMAAETAGLWLWEAGLKGEGIWDMNRPKGLGLETLNITQAFAALSNHVQADDLAVLQQRVRHAIASHAPSLMCRYRLNAPDGSRRHYQLHARVIYDASNQPVRLVGVTSDITQEILHTEQLEQQSQQQRLLNERMKIAARAAGLWVWERDAHDSQFVWDENPPPSLGLAGVPYCEYHNQLRSRIAAEDRSELERLVADAKARKLHNYTLRYRTRDLHGLIRHQQSEATVLYDDQGTALRIIGVTRDITAEIQTTALIQRQAQHESDLASRLTTATQAAGIHCWQVNFPDPSAGMDMVPVMVWSENAASELGIDYPGHDLNKIFAACLHTIHPDDRALMTVESNAAMFAGIEQRSIRHRMMLSDGTLRHMHKYQRFFRHADGSPSHIVGATRDITREVLAAQQLEQQADELRNLHTRMERAALSSQEGHWELDLISHAYWASASYRALLGYPADFDLSTVERHHALVHPDDMAISLQERIEQLGAGELFSHVKRMRHANGEWRWMQTQGSIERDATGHALRLTGSIRDIHEHKLAEEKLRTAQERFNRAINGTQDGLWEVDLLTHKMWLSPRYSEMLGYEPSETMHWVGPDLDRVTHPDDLAMIDQQRLRTFANNQPLNFEHRMRTKRGEWIWVRVRGIVERNAQGQAVRVAGSMSDITTAHEAHEQLIKATEAAQEANLAKSAFLANMSHEIRTPMNGIIGMTGLLLDTELDHAQRDFADTIRSSADSLLNIINDILDFSKIEAGKLDIEVIDMDLRNHVEDVGAMLGFQAASKQLELVVHVHPDIPERVLGDPQRIRQCLINLLGNAIKFTAQGEVVIEVSCLGERDGKLLLHFEVRDTGIGLSAEAMAQLFQPFTQADSSTTRRYGGTGLGLSIVKRLIDLMGGQVGVSSTMGKGSTFWFTLPLAAAEQIDTTLTTTIVTQVNNKRILIVDDNQTNRQVLSLQLEHLGYQVSIASSGHAALEEMYRRLARQQQFDAVLVDFQMPDMDGAMLGARISADPKLSQPRLILLTSLDRQGDPQHFADLGFTAYLTKPIRARELRDCLQYVLANDTQEWRGQKPALLTRNAIREQVAAERFSGTVLVVDDNAVNQKVASRFLERIGLTVTIANDGADALKIYESGNFDMVFMDLQMPVMDGFEATRRIRDFEAWRPRTPIIALTANVMSGQLERCLATGMDGFLSKPIQIEQLRELVAKHCQKVSVPPDPRGLDGAMTAQLLETPVAQHQLHLDIEQLRITTDGDAAFMRELAQLYLDSSQQILVEMRAAQTSNDRMQLCRAAHKLKGASAGIHAQTVAERCAIVERHGLEMHAEELAKQLEQLEQTVAKVAEDLHVLIKDDQSVA